MYSISVLLHFYTSLLEYEKTVNLHTFIVFSFSSSSAVTFGLHSLSLDWLIVNDGKQNEVKCSIFNVMTLSLCCHFWQHLTYETITQDMVHLTRLHMSASRSIFHAWIYWINCLSCTISPTNTINVCLQWKFRLSTKSEWMSFIHLTLWPDIIQANSAIGSVKCSHFRCEIRFHLRRMAMAKHEITVGQQWNTLTLQVAWEECGEHESGAEVKWRIVGAAGRTW